MKQYTSTLIQTAGIKQHYISYTSVTPTLLCLHGLTANCFAFHGLIQDGLDQLYEVISLDFRGRGKTETKAFQNDIDDHAKDVIDLLDALHIDSISLMGHSFGALISSYLAFHYPNRIREVILLDAAPEMNPRIAEMLVPSVSRLDKSFENFEEYLTQIKQAEFMTLWDDAMMAYYLGDIEKKSDGRVECIPDFPIIAQISMAVARTDWTKYYFGMHQKSLLVAGKDTYTLRQVVLPNRLAKKAALQMKNCTLVSVQGNHHTMLYAAGARQIIEAIENWKQQ